MGRKFHDLLLIDLEDLDYALEYLSVALECYYEEEDIDSLVTAVEDVLEARHKKSFP